MDSDDKLGLKIFRSPWTSSSKAFFINAAESYIIFLHVYLSLCLSVRVFYRIHWAV